MVDEPEAPPALIEPLADVFRENNLAIAPVVRRILTSNLFFSDQVMGRKVRSPVEMAIGFLRALEGTTNNVELSAELARLGHGLFYPPNVKGWDGGRSWINSQTLLGRANLMRRLLYGENTRFGRGDIASYAASRGADSPEALIDWLHGLLFAVPIPAATRQQLVQLARRGDGDKNESIARVVHAMCTLPEFHLG